MAAPLLCDCTFVHRVPCPCACPLPYVYLPERDLLVQSLTLTLPVFILTLRYCTLPERGIIACIRLFSGFFTGKRGYFSQNRVFYKLLIVRGKVRVRHRTETTICRPVLFGWH